MAPWLQALVALRFLCKLDIVHNDIKLDNFLLYEQLWHSIVYLYWNLLCNYGFEGALRKGCEAAWTQNRRLCDALSLTGTFCVFHLSLFVSNSRVLLQFH